jgi:hypothetical protein
VKREGLFIRRTWTILARTKRVTTAIRFASAIHPHVSEENTMARLTICCTCATLVVVSGLLGACGASTSPPPAVTASESTSPEKAPTSSKVAAHDLQTPPRATTGNATQEGKWWAAARPCPEGAQMWGVPPPKQKEVGCKTDKGVNLGMYTRFFDNGKKAEEGEYKKHMAVNTWTKWNEAGSKITETQYEDGAQHGIETEWYEAGKIKSQRSYVNGKRDGLTTIWDEAGHKRSAIEYKDAKQHGPATYWDEKGHVARVEQWENGQKVK